MFYNVKKYLEKEVSERKIITFGGAFSNHIAAAAALGNEFGIKTLGIIRGNELENSWQENPNAFFGTSKWNVFQICNQRNLSIQRKNDERTSRRISRSTGCSRRWHPMKMR
jgi:1-aminocyclopropane-1-carboxylate deaminase/D-cysteine desulfhydrase-like pyridoxal-dependent ACC family enzyme